MTITLEFVSGNSSTFKGITSIKEEEGYIKVINASGKGLGFVREEVVGFYTVADTSNKVVN